MPKGVIYTIGHSNHETGKFVKLLHKYNINAVVDVRSIPYSRYNSQFNKDNIRNSLEDEAIHYLYLGEQLGAQYNDPNLFDNNGIINFKKVRQRDDFKKGLSRILNGLDKGYLIAVMCSEKDPLKCHRFVLISYALKKKKISVKHILADRSVIDQKKLESKLVKLYKKELKQQSLFNDYNNNQLDKAYQLRNKDIGDTLY